MSTYSITDEETRVAMVNVFKKNGYLLDPHGAVGYIALERYLKENGGEGIFLETAHPVKFLDVVVPVIGKDVELPPSVKKLTTKPQYKIAMRADFEVFKEYLLSR